MPTVFNEPWVSSVKPLLAAAMPFDFQTIATIGGGILAAFFLLLWVLRQVLLICPPNRVLVVSGRGKGSDREGYRLAFGGLVARIPVLERVDEMQLNTIPINISVVNAYSKGGIVLHVEAVANIKITSDEALIHKAIERFLGRDADEVKRAAQDTLEGNLREVLAKLTPEQVNEDRLRFAESILEIAEDDLKRLGLHLDTLKIQHVSDTNDYLDSIGRKQIALIVRDAEIAESNARREAENVAAKAQAEAQVARERAESDVAKSRNELRQLRAELEAKARTEEEKTTAAAMEARARAEQELQSIRANLEELRLQADQIIPAEAKRQAQELLAKGAAAPISENGKALASALEEMALAWKDAGHEARDIFLIQQLEKILSIVVERVQGMDIQQVNLIDNGDGSALPNYVRAFPDTVAAILQSLRNTTGIDIAETLTGRVNALGADKSEATG